MNTQSRHWLFAFLLIALLLPAGCGDDEAPMEPDPGPQIIEQVRITTTILRFEAIKDGDGIEGAGEFEFTVEVNWVDKSWERQLSSGQSSTLNWTTETTYNYDGDPVTTWVEFTCSEMDKNIADQTYPDADMNNRNARAEHAVPGSTITNYITLGNDNCKVRLHYRIVSEVVQVEVP